jgi:hypothetical protein
MRQHRYLSLILSGLLAFGARAAAETAGSQAARPAGGKFTGAGATSPSGAATQKTEMRPELSVE